jgi:carbamoyltransferase
MTPPGRTLERTLQGTLSVRPEWAERLAAVTHVDGSACVQVLEPGDAPLLEGVLDCFHRETGLPVLVNTSFNHAGEPIVNDIADALVSLERCRLDALAVYPYLYTRET